MPAPVRTGGGGGEWSREREAAASGRTAVGRGGPVGLFGPEDAAARRLARRDQRGPILGVKLFLFREGGEPRRPAGEVVIQDVERAAQAADDQQQAARSSRCKSSSLWGNIVNSEGYGIHRRRG